MKQTVSFFDDNKFLIAMLVIVFLLAVISYLGAHWDSANIHGKEVALAMELKQSNGSAEDLATRLEVELQALNQREYAVELLHHLSLAFIISFITILAVEFHTRRQLREDLTSHLEAVKVNVWEALGKRLLGSLIAVELEAIMKEDAAKKDSSYVITFKPPSEGCPDDRIIVLIENSYKLRNLTGVPGRTHRIFSSISNYEQVGPFPRFTSFKVDEEPQSFEDAIDPSDSRTLRRVVSLPEDGEASVAVVVAMEIVYKARDSESFVTAVPVEGLRVTVVNQIPDRVGSVTVDMSSGTAEHPNDSSWIFNRAMLPGQGFSLSWRKPDSQEPEHNDVKPSVTML
jgi:hypothetical protein